MQIRKVPVVIALFILTSCTSNAVKTASTESFIPISMIDYINIETDIVSDTALAAEPEPPAEPELDYNSVKPNEIGEIMIIMYHGLSSNPKKPRYFCTAEEFSQNLADMYEAGYRLTALSDLVNNSISVAAGYTPVVLTFDDGLSSAFSLQEKEGELIPSEDCAVHIINKFSEEHPDFGKSAVFFINGQPDAFKGAGTLSERLKYLADNGYEIGNHTYNHVHLRKHNADSIQEQIGKLDQLIRANLYSYESLYIAYPYGERPSAELQSFLLSGEYDDVPYQYYWVIREGQSGASAAPDHINFDPLNVPRVRGTNNENTDLGWQLRRYRKNPELRYISDGDPNKISVPSELSEYVNVKSTRGVEYFFYDTD